MSNMKPCTKCKESKLLTEFHTDSRTSDGKHNICKVCRRSHCSKKYKTYYIKHRAEVLQKLKQYYILNSEALKKVNRLRYWCGRDVRKVYHKNNTEVVK